MLAVGGQRATRGSIAGIHCPLPAFCAPFLRSRVFLGTLLEKILRVETEDLGFKTEIIVVDDGSVDKTAEIAARFPQDSAIHFCAASSYQYIALSFSAGMPSPASYINARLCMAEPYPR